MPCAPQRNARFSPLKLPCQSRETLLISFLFFISLLNEQAKISAGKMQEGPRCGSTFILPVQSRGFCKEHNVGNAPTPLALAVTAGLSEALHVCKCTDVLQDISALRAPGILGASLESLSYRIDRAKLLRFCRLGKPCRNGLQGQSGVALSKPGGFSKGRSRAVKLITISSSLNQTLLSRPFVPHDRRGKCSNQQSNDARGSF